MGKKSFSLNQDILKLLLPEGLFNYFDFDKIEAVDDSFFIYLVEKNIHPIEFEGHKLESKGFFDAESVRDFPLRGKPSELKLNRRKGFNPTTGQIIYRNWDIVAKGTRMTMEFANFLKGAFG